MYHQQDEVIYRNGIKTVLVIHQNNNNKIMYAESNLLLLECNIKARQLKFCNSFVTTIMTT